MAPQYTHGHTPAVLRSHSWRTLDNSGAFLKPHLKPTDRLLDCGCGPGTLTCDFAALLTEGSVVGVEVAEGVLAQARATAEERGLRNVIFEVADGMKLPYDEGSFDVVYAHQVLQHVPDPVGILRELKRVVRVGGIVAIRDTDYSSFTWSPDDSRLDHWNDTYLRTARANGGEPNAGRHLLSWALRAGWRRNEVTCSSSSWCFASEEEKAWWGGLWAERIVNSNLATTAKEHGIATQEQLEEMSMAFSEWKEKEEAWFACLHGEILCRRSG